VEAARDEGAAAQRLDFADAVYDVAALGSEPGELVLHVVLARPVLLLLLVPRFHLRTHAELGRGSADRDPGPRQRGRRRARSRCGVLGGALPWVLLHGRSDSAILPLGHFTGVSLVQGSGAQADSGLDSFKCSTL
jgi:hypothetical protein